MKYWNTLEIETDTFQRGAYGIQFTCICSNDVIGLDPYDAVFYGKTGDICSACGRAYRLRATVEILQEYVNEKPILPEIVSAPRPDTKLEEERTVNTYYRTLLNDLAEHVPYSTHYSQVIQEAIRIIDKEKQDAAL